MSKLENIDNLLKNDGYLEKYISEIEKKEIQSPSDLEQNILSKINRKKKNKYADICKIAACLIFSLAICRTDFIKNDEFTTSKIETKSQSKETSTTINKKISDICKWLTTPIEFEEEEK